MTNPIGNPPLIGITADNRDNAAASGQYESSIAYSQAVAAAGGLPVLLPHQPELARAYLDRLDGLVLTGGVDPDTAAFGQPMHPRARPMDPRRQAFELALLDHLATHRPEAPVLGVCLGMQLMALHAGGALHQYLPEVLLNPQMHQHNHRHPVCVRAVDSVLEAGPLKRPCVVSYHQQAVAHPGGMRVIATAPDGVIEAIDAPERRFYLGVQWHPERGPEADEAGLNRGLIRRLVQACRPAT